MTLIYGSAIAVGAAGLLVAIALAVNPERPDLPTATRNGILGVFGFGMAGMSSSFGGWSSGLAFVAGLGGAAILIGLAMRYSAARGE